MRVIALTGYAGSGKSEVSSILCEEFGYTRVKFAGPLKDMLRVLGLGEREIEGDLKEAPCELLSGRSPRHAMVTLGTEWGRDLMHKDFWTNIWKARVVDVLRSTSGGVVVDDCRFVNEVALVRELGGEVWRVLRPAVVPSSHISEAGQATLPSDRTIMNDGTGADWREHLALQVRGYLLAGYVTESGSGMQRTI